MNKKSFFTRALIGLLAILLAAPLGAFAQENTNTGQSYYSHRQLAQMLAPVALYPDSLLAQVLVASTYPDQIREAHLWVEQHPELRGEALNNALDQQNWDLSIKALVPFPKVLAMMDDKPQWTQDLGYAFLNEQADVMSTIQTLRARAKAAGNLRTTAQERVVVKGDNIEIQPADPQVVYVPYYNPVVVYGAWPYPAYPPFAYFPYYPGPDFIAFGALGFAAGIAVGAAWNWGWGRWDWGHRDIDINVNRTVNINRNYINRNNVRTASLRAPAGRRALTATRTTRVAAANRRAAGAAGAANARTAARQRTATRPSTAAVRNQLRQGNRVARNNRAVTRPGANQFRRGTIARNGAVSRRGAANLSRRAAPRGNMVARGGFAPRGGPAFRSAAPRGGAGFRAAAPRGGASSRGGAGFGRGGGGRAVAHGGGGGVRTAKR